jgi:hypothetical protein
MIFTRTQPRSARAAAHSPPASTAPRCYVFSHHLLSGNRTNKHFLDGHHLRHWADGGEASIDNLALLCSSHHSYVHERGYQIIKDETAALRFLDPHGKCHPRRATPPEPAVPGLARNSRRPRRSATHRADRPQPLARRPRRSSRGGQRAVQASTAREFPIPAPASALTSAR